MGVQQVWLEPPLNTQHAAGRKVEVEVEKMFIVQFFLGAYGSLCTTMWA
jgi:hypothetical protein